MLRHIRVESKEELKDRLMAAMDYFNQEPVVPTWSYGLDRAKWYDSKHEIDVLVRRSAGVHKIEDRLEPSDDVAGFQDLLLPFDTDRQ